MESKLVKLPNNAHGIIVTGPDDKGMVEVIINNSARLVVIHKDKLTKR